MLSHSKQDLIEQLMAVVEQLPNEQIEEVSEYAKDLHSRIVNEQPKRGSIEAIRQAMQHVGPLQFEQNELESLLAEIEAMRDQDMDEHG